MYVNSIHEKKKDKCETKEDSNARSWYKRFLFHLINLYVITWIKILALTSQTLEKRESNCP